MATVLESIKRYQYIIEKSPHDEHKVLKCINKLFHLDVTVQHLQETGVGRTINALRKEPGDVGPAARSLVQKWKEMVAADESEEDGYKSHETATYNGHGSGRESDDNGRQDTRVNNSNVTTKMNGHHSGTKREYHSSEDEESNVKRSKYSYDDYNKNCNKSKKEEAVKLKREESNRVSKVEPDIDSHESNESGSGESYSSESSVEHRKAKNSDKKASSSNHKSSKYSSHNNHNDQKADSSTSKKTHHTEKHSEYHTSSSKERYSSDKLSVKEKYHSSHKHKGSYDKDIIPDKKQKSDQKSSDHKSSKESKSTSKHSKIDDHRSKHEHDSSEKHKSTSEKHTTKSDKHRSSSQLHNTEKDKHKQPEAEITKHKSKDSNGSSSKDKHRSSSKEKSKEKNNSSKDKLSSHNSDKHIYTNDGKSSGSEHKSKTEKHESKSSGKKSNHKSSSSSDHKNDKNGSKIQEDIPKKKENENNEDSDDGIDCGSGASFAEALGMISPVKTKKKLAYSKDIQSPNSSFSNDLSPAALLAPTAKLAPLPAIEITALPEISPNYRPRQPLKVPSHLIFTDEEALNAGISSKNQRTKVYSGNKVFGKIPSLYEMCVHILQEHIDALEFTGGVPYSILKPVVDRATPQQLFTLEHFNPYLMEDTDHLWQTFCAKSFRNKQRHEMESWREMYLRCQEEQEHRLKSLTANIKIAQEAKKAPIKQTKMAYVDTVVKPPRNIARKQAQHGTAHASSASPAARVASLASAPNVARVGAVRPPPSTSMSTSAAHKPKKAPLMQKALQFMRGRKR